MGLGRLGLLIIILRQESKGIAILVMGPVGLALCNN